MDLRQYLQAILRFWWVILIPAVLGAALGMFSVSRADPVYEGSVTYFVSAGDEGSANSQFAGDQFAQRRVNSYVALLSSDRLANMIAEAADTDLSPKAISNMLSATGDIDTVLLTATARSSSEREAQEVISAAATELVQLVNEVENSAGGPSGVRLEVVSGPTVSTVPTRAVLAIGVRAFLGLAVGLALALALELRDTSVRSDEQLEQLGAGPTLARIPFDRRVEEAPLIIVEDSQSIRAETYRQLRTNLQFIDVEDPIKVLVVTSSVAGEGKSSLSANLALAVVADHRSVLLIEGDFRRPQVADSFGLERAVGLTDVLAGRVQIEDVLQPWGTDGLVVLPSGQLPPNPSELLGSDAMARLLERFRAEFDLVIVDTPPLLPVTDAAVVATRADGVLVVVRAAKTTRHQVSVAIRSLQAVGARVLGSVLTMTAAGKASGYSSYRYDPTMRTAAESSIDAEDPSRGARRGGPEPDRAERVAATGSRRSASGRRKKPTRSNRSDNGESGLGESAGIDPGRERRPEGPRRR